MHCPYCKANEDRVVDSRLSEGGFAIRRRRHCRSCERRYTTYERIEESPLRIVKKDGTREPYDRQKILDGLIKACEKRPIATARLEDIVNRIELDIYEHFGNEVKTKYIGELVMNELRDLDQVAYVRFASVYREFKDLQEFMQELAPMIDRPEPTVGPARPRRTP